MTKIDENSDIAEFTLSVDDAIKAKGLLKYINKIIEAYENCFLRSQDVLKI